jgi:glycosyltransferase involved in cell wall biosynthesis
MVSIDVSLQGCFAPNNVRARSDQRCSRIHLMHIHLTNQVSWLTEVGVSESVALVSTVDPYPAEAGHKVVLAGFLDYLMDRVGANNVHYVLVGGPDMVGFPAHLHRIPKPSALVALGNVVIRTGTGLSSLQESLLRSRRVREDIHRTLERISPALEIYDTIRMAQHAPAHSEDKQICYLDDLFSKRYKAMLDAMHRYRDVDIQPVANFAHFVPGPLHPLAEQPVSQRLLLRVEESLVRHSEDRVADRFGTTLLLNEREADHLRHRSGVDASRIQAIPPLIAQPTSMTREYDGAPEFVFLGHLRVPHNDDGLRSFLTDVWPLVLADRPHARLRVVGREPREWLTDVVARHADTVTLEGFVSDLTGIFGRAAALVNPLRFGSGIKLKIVEALGAGLPVISTSIGADGVWSGPDSGVLVADDHAQMADLLVQLADRDKNVQLSSAAREHFVSRYSRKAVFPRYDAAFGLG